MNLAALDLNLLFALDRLLAHRSVTRAAADLGLTQSATSRVLGRLRDTLDDPLLVRVGRTFILTDRARDLVEPTREAVLAVERVFAPPDAFNPATATGAWHLSLGDETQHVFVEPLARAFATECPGIDLRVHLVSRSTLEEARRGELDLVLAPDLQPLPDIVGAPDLSAFVTRRVYTRRFVVLSRDARALDLDAYCDASHVIVSFEGGGRGFMDDLLASHGRTRRVAVSVSSFPAAGRVVASSNIVATVPEEVAWANPQLHVQPSPIDVPALDMMLIWHPYQTTDARHRFLRGLTQRVVAGVAAQSV